MNETLFDEEVEYTPAGWAGADSARGLALSPDVAHPEKAAKHFEAHVHEMLFLKTKDWASEYEYRYAAVTPGHDFDFVEFGNALKTVIVGERFPMWQAAGVIELCEEAGAEAKQLSFLKEGPFVVPLVAWSELEPHLRDRARRVRYGTGAHPPSV